MPEMCKVPGCPDLATDRVTIDDVTVPFCNHCVKKVRANLPRIQEQLRQHEKGAPCSLDRCGERAVAQLWFGGEWINVCPQHQKKLTENLSILSGKPPHARPLKTYYRQAPEVRIEDLGWAEKKP